jgi:hypothetical protein
VRSKELAKLGSKRGLHLSLAEGDASGARRQTLLVRRSQRPVHGVTERLIAKGVGDLERQTFEVIVPHHAISRAHYVASPLAFHGDSMSCVARVVAVQHLSLHGDAQRLGHVGECRGPRVTAPGARDRQDRVAGKRQAPDIMLAPGAHKRGRLVEHSQASRAGGHHGHVLRLRI